MRNKHRFKKKATIKCPFTSCGKTFDKEIIIEYVTNQRGDVIEEKIMN